MGLRPRLAHLALLTLLAAAIIASFRAVGVLLVFGFLVAPPATATAAIACSSSCRRWRRARRRRPLTAAELATTALVHREPGSGTRYTLEAALAPHGPVGSPLVELSSTTAVKAAVEAGVGPAVLSSLATADELAHGQLVAVDVEGVELDWALRVVCPGPRHPGMGEMRDVLAVAARSEGERITDSNAVRSGGSRAAAAGGC